MIRIKTYKDKQELLMKTAYNTWRRMKVRQEAIANITNQEYLAILAMNPYLKSSLRFYAHFKIKDKDLIKKVLKINSHSNKMSALKFSQKLDAKWWARVIHKISLTYWKFWGLFQKKVNFDESLLDEIELDDDILQEYL